MSKPTFKIEMLAKDRSKSEEENKFIIHYDEIIQICLLAANNVALKICLFGLDYTNHILNLG